VSAGVLPPLLGAAAVAVEAVSFAEESVESTAVPAEGAGGAGAPVSDGAGDAGAVPESAGGAPPVLGAATVVSGVELVAEAAVGSLVEAVEPAAGGGAAGLGAGDAEDPPSGSGEVAVSVVLVTAPVTPLVSDVVGSLTPFPPSVGHRRYAFSRDPRCTSRAFV
jgi:hypothetical protein